MLLRSDDLGESWQVASSMPEGTNSVPSLHVEATTSGELTAWVAVSEAGLNREPAPFVRTPFLN